MPRVANPPSGKGTVQSKQSMATPRQQSPTKLALNDDRGEKAARFQSRQALHDIQMNQIKVAASPMRRLNGHERANSSSPRTPKTAAAGKRSVGKENGGRDSDSGSPGVLNVVNGSAVTPMKRVPILANFEEWMKMATDNKINAANSWNFALIDYFHDMSLLKEGDGVNFQKASCTLDGCVKIYTSRVDSVATETGKLLSGLADSGNKKGKEAREGEDEEGDDEGDEEDGGDGARKKTKKKTTRSHEATLAPSFASLQVKKMELEFAVDPLFKKASADFDEGGAKGLLLNHLSIDSEGRIVFDSSDDMGEAAAEGETEVAARAGSSDKNTVPENDSAEPDEEFDLSSLASKFFPDLLVLDSQDICPSLKSFALGDPSSDLSIPFLKAPDDWREAHKDKPTIPAGGLNLGDQTGMFIDASNAAGFDDDDDGGLLGGFDLPPDTGFGEGGEAWAKDAALEPMLRVACVDGNGDVLSSTDGGAQVGIAVGDFDPANPFADEHAVSLNHSKDGDEHGNILSYFDNALRSQKAAQWAGPEHWRIRKIKQATQNTATNTAPTRQRKEKEPFEIDFLAPMDQSLAEMLYTPASSNSAISLPKAQWKTKGRNLLPDDRHFNSRDLLKLWLKPRARVGRKRPVAGLPAREGVQRAAAVENDGRHEMMDEAYWAKRKEEHLSTEGLDLPAKGGDYDANFFADDDAGLPFAGGIPDDIDDDEQGPAGFVDAREMLSPPPSAANGDERVMPSPEVDSQDPHSQQTGMLPGSFGSQLVTQGGKRLRPEYVNYARVAKKVDVRRLKENMWKGMSASLISSVDRGKSAAAAEDTAINNDPPTPAPTDTDGDVDMMDLDEDEPPRLLPPSSSTDLEASAMMQTQMQMQMQQQIDQEAAAAAERGGGGGGRQGPPPAANLKFTELMGGLKTVYPEQQMRDISTSYCFICLLHLANEKGLVLEGEKDNDRMQEILVRRDLSVGEGYVGE